MQNTLALCSIIMKIKKKYLYSPFVSTTTAKIANKITNS